MIHRPCAVIRTGDEGGRMILPSFGALTGGMDAADPAILAAMQPAQRIDAVFPAGRQTGAIPLMKAHRLIGWRYLEYTGGSFSSRMACTL